MVWVKAALFPCDPPQPISSLQGAALLVISKIFWQLWAMGGAGFQHLFTEPCPRLPGDVLAGGGLRPRGEMTALGGRQEVASLFCLFSFLLWHKQSAQGVN